VEGPPLLPTAFSVPSLCAPKGGQDSACPIGATDPGESAHLSNTPSITWSELRKRPEPARPAPFARAAPGIRILVALRRRHMHTEASVHLPPR